MTMNFNFSSIGANAASKAFESSQTQQASSDVNSSRNDAFSPTLSITQGLATSEDIAAAAIGDNVLTRDDPLGNLVKSAFNLPPPPPPWNAL